MSKLTYKASYYALYAMFAIILIVMGVFFFGGDATGDAVIPGVDPEMWQPAQTDALLYLMYALFGIAIAATVIAAVFQFGAALKDNPASAIKSLLGFVLLVVGCWFEAISVCNHITCVSKLSCKFIDGIAAQPRPLPSSRRLPF